MTRNLTRAIFCLVRTMAKHLIYKTEGEARREIERDLEIVETAWHTASELARHQDAAKRLQTPKEKR